VGVSDLFRNAERSVLVAGYAIYQGQRESHDYHHLPLARSRVPGEVPTPTHRDAAVLFGSSFGGKTGKASTTARGLNSARRTDSITRRRIRCRTVRRTTRSAAQMPEIGTIGFAGILNQMDTIALVKVTGCQEGMNRVMSFAT